MERESTALGVLEHRLVKEKAELPDPSVAAEIVRKLTVGERLWNSGLSRKLLIMTLLLLLWQWYAVKVDNPLVFPTMTATIQALWDAVTRGELPARVVVSLKVLLVGYGAGVALAAVLAIAATASRLGNDLLEILTAMFNPLPAIALLPVALLWFGLGSGSIIFVLIHAVLWPVALNTHAGFTAISVTVRMVGRNYGLRGIRYAGAILIPAAFPHILTGMKIGWAFAWRTLIAAELVFGVSSGSGGIGWFIYENKNQLEIATVFAGLMTVVLIGLGVENLLFRTVEQRTIRRWGMRL